MRPTSPVILSAYTVYLDLWLCDLDGNVIANGRPERFNASDGQDLLSEYLSLSLDGRRSGFHHDRSGALIAFHATPGYETYRGLGWFGVIVSGAG